MPARLGSLFALLLAIPLADADTAVLKSGARIVDANRSDDSPANGRIALTTPHGRLILDRAQLAKLDTDRPADKEYRRRTPSIADTVDAQFAHAMWCRDNGLGDEARRHWRRVVDLAPDHAEARKLLGFNSVDGRWLTREEVMEARGLVRWEGAFRTRQEIALVQRQRRIEAEQISWRRRLAAWRNDLVGRDTGAARSAEESFRSLDDPSAAAELIRLLRRESNERAKQELIETLGRLATTESLVALADVALIDPNPNARSEAIDQLARSRVPGIAAPFVGALRAPDNQLVNRGGEALASLGNDTVLEPLIDALITKHKRVIGNASGGQRYDINTNSGFFGVGGGPREEEVIVRNPGVLAALVELTGENFVFDEPRWRAWLASRQIQLDVDLRRDN